MNRVSPDQYLSVCELSLDAIRYRLGLDVLNEALRASEEVFHPLTRAIHVSEDMASIEAFSREPWRAAFTVAKLSFTGDWDAYRAKRVGLNEKDPQAFLERWLEQDPVMAKRYIVPRTETRRIKQWCIPTSRSKRRSP